MKVSIAGTIAVLLLAAGCAGPDALRPAVLTLTSPRPMQHVTAPLEVRWDDPAGHDRYAVFLDRTPLAPGASLRSLAEAEDDRACLSNRACPDAEWLAARGVHLADGHELTLEVIPEEPGALDRPFELHTLSVVRLDGDRRSGAAGATIEFAVPRGPSA